MIIAGFIIALVLFLVGSILGAMEAENIIQKASENVFQIEKVITGWFKEGNVLEDLLNLVLAIAISISIFKLLKKILEIYVIGTDGDDTESPFFFIIVNFVRTMATIFLYRPFFDWIVDIYRIVLDKITVIAGVAKTTLHINVIGELNKVWREKQLTDFDSISGQIRALTNQDPYKVTDSLTSPPTFNFLFQMMWLILLIMVLVLYVRLISRGVELYILKLGFPIAAIGLMDNDKGIFKDYAMLFIQALTTIVVQIFLLNVALISMVALKGGYDIFSLSLSLAITSLAISTPELLNKFLIPSRGGSGRGTNMMMNLFMMTSRMTVPRRPKVL